MKDQSACEKNSSTRETVFSTRKKSQNCARDTLFSTWEKNQKSFGEIRKWARKVPKKRGKVYEKANFCPWKKEKLGKKSDSRPLLPFVTQKQFTDPPSYNLPPHTHTHTYTHTHTNTNTKKNHSKLPFRRSKLSRTKRCRSPSFARDYGQLVAGCERKKMYTTHPTGHLVDGWLGGWGSAGWVDGGMVVRWLWAGVLVARGWWLMAKTNTHTVATFRKTTT